MSDASQMKIEPELASRLGKMAHDEPDTRVGLIITLTSGTDPQSLTDEGFVVDQVLDLISGVSGTATAQQVLKIANLPQVEKIESDGKMYALES